LLRRGLLDGSTMTVTGNTLADTLAPLPGLPGMDSDGPTSACVPANASEEIFRPIERPLKPTGHITILRGNVAPGGAVAKITGKEGVSFTG
jgi:dihydroxy-acid dehydratase